MKKTLFLTGNSLPLIKELSKEYLDNEYNIIIAPLICIKEPGEEIEKSALLDESEFYPHDLPILEGVENHPLLLIPIERVSPFSVRNTILEGLKRFENIDEVLILYSPTGDNRPLHQLPASTVEEIVDTGIKGNFYILKQVLDIFLRNNRGILTFVLYLRGIDTLPPIDASICGCFRKLVDSIFTFYRNESIMINGIESKSADPVESAKYICKTVSEKAQNTFGKWYRHSGRQSFLQALKPKTPPG
ncbi:MAG: hypothetical protein DRP87_07390 [Spirochaetes bacterium]|nr:MAG: hypothetical protein DRP87_07390 [Spirochaetota bacterium]